MNGINFEEHIFRAPTSKTLVLIPILNERENIFNQLSNMVEATKNFDVVLVDGGSSDGTLENILKLQELGVCGVLVKRDIGKLSTQLRLGFTWALDKHYSNVVTMDGNNKDDPEGIYRITEKLESGFDFVQGSRFVENGKAINTPLHRLFAIRFIHAPLTSIFARRRYTDSTNGFRGYSVALLKSKKMSIFRPDFKTYELLAYFPIRSSRLGFRCTEVGVSRSYPDEGPIPTKIHGIRGNFEILKILLFAGFGKYNP
jgi:dolichol-phosphate mannosyltransferase